MHVLIATDAEWVLREILAALSDSETSFDVCRNGKDVVTAVKGKLPDVAVLDLQIGSMGGMAVTMELRLDESAGALPHVPVIMLLDRAADVHLARRSGAEGWLVKPLDALRLRRATHIVASGGIYHEGEAAQPAGTVDPEAPHVAEDGEAVITG